MHQSTQEAQPSEPEHRLSACLALVGNSRPPIPNHLATRMANGRRLGDRGIERFCKSRVLERPLARARRPLRKTRHFTYTMSTTPLHTSLSSRIPSLFSAHRVYVRFLSRPCLGHLPRPHQPPHPTRRQLPLLSPPKARARQYQEGRSSLVMRWRDTRLPTSSASPTFMPEGISASMPLLHLARTRSAWP